MEGELLPALGAGVEGGILDIDTHPIQGCCKPGHSHTLPPGMRSQVPGSWPTTSFRAVWSCQLAVPDTLAPPTCLVEIRLNGGPVVGDGAIHLHRAGAEVRCTKVATGACVHAAWCRERARVLGVHVLPACLHASCSAHRLSL